MKRMIVGIVIASIVLYAWGFIFWGLGPLRTMIWNQSMDDVEAGQALLENFP